MAIGLGIVLIVLGLDICPGRHQRRHVCGRHRDTRLDPSRRGSTGHHRVTGDQPAAGAVHPRGRGASRRPATTMNLSAFSGTGRNCP